MKMRTLLLFLLAACLLAGAALAAPGLDVTRLGSIRVTVRDTATQSPVPGGTLTLYPVASLSEEDGNELLTYNDAFAACGVPVASLLEQLPADALADYAAQQKLSGTTLAVDAEGTAVFSDLPVGLYLVVQTAPARNREAIRPFLVSLPQRVGDTRVYDVDASPKLGTTNPKPSAPPAVPPADRLPQTGQLWWPVPLLAVLGLLCIALGWRKRT